MGAHTLACKLSQVSWEGDPAAAPARPSGLPCQRANFSLLVWKMFGFVLRKEGGGKNQKEKSRMVEIQQI